MITPGFYKLVMLEEGSETYWGCVEILEVDQHLIKVKFGKNIHIFNTSASTFISATPVDAPSKSSFAIFGTADE